MNRDQLPAGRGSRRQEAAGWAASRAGEQEAGGKGLSAGAGRAASATRSFGRGEQLRSRP